VIDDLSRQEVLVVPGEGKFVWDPVLEILDFVSVGNRRESASWALTRKQNNRTDALKKALRMALKEVSHVTSEGGGAT
jgi:hypothetical protein